MSAAENAETIQVPKKVARELAATGMHGLDLFN